MAIFVGVTPQVVDHRPGPGKGTLGHKLPGFGEERAEELRVFSRKGLRSAAPSGTHHPAQGFLPGRGNRLPGPASNSRQERCSAGAQCSAGADAGEVLAPGVQYGDHARTRTQVNAVPCKGVDHAPCRGKERVIDPLRCVQAQAVEFPGRVNTTWKYGTGNSPPLRAANQSSRASPRHLGQWRFRQLL